MYDIEVRTERGNKVIRETKKNLTADEVQQVKDHHRAVAVRGDSTTFKVTAVR